jgi:membrane protein YdbS with pleckstrin-like domain
MSDGAGGGIGTARPEGVARRPSPRLWAARQTVLFTIATVWALVAGGVAAAGGAGIEAGVGPGIIAVLTAIAWLLLRGRYRSWEYTEREDDLLVTRGFLVRRESVVPYGRMQMLDVTAGLIDRGFGLATVRLHTASAATDARIPGLPREEANRLRDRLAELGEARGAGL